MCDIINNFNNKINDIVNKNIETKINEIKNKVSKKIIELYKNKDVKKIKLNDILKLFDEFNDNNINILYDEELEIYKSITTNEVKSICLEVLKPDQSIFISTWDQYPKTGVTK
jgi:restriction endonuclease Mrr